MAVDNVCKNSRKQKSDAEDSNGFGKRSGSEKMTNPAMLVRTYFVYLDDNVQVRS